MQRRINSVTRLLLIAATASALAAVYAAAGWSSVGALPSCPAHAPEATTLDVATRRFVRPGAVVVRLCRYSNVNWGDSQRLVRRRTIRSGATISSLTRAFNELRTPQKGIFCPRDDGSEMLVAFGYAGSAEERVIVKLSGCRFALNGRSSRWMTAALQKRLLALVAHP